MTGSFRSRFAVGAALVVLASLLAASSLAATSRQTGGTVSVPSLQRGVLAGMNAFRAQHHLGPLRLSAGLTASATQHSLEMAQDGYFAHDSADGSAFWRRIERSYPSSSWGYWSVGENLLWSSPGIDAAGALRLWKQSPEHLANLLATRWREVGISAVHVPAAPGVFHGLSVTIVTADFGVRR